MYGKFALFALLTFAIVLVFSTSSVDSRYLIIPRYRRSGYSDQARAALETLLALRRHDTDRNSIITYDPSKRETSSGFLEKNFIDLLESPE